MCKSRLLVFVLLLSVILSLFAGCWAQNADVPTAPILPSASSKPSESTDPSSEVTEPSSEATEPSATVCPRTIEAFKTNIKPYMTYGEAKELWGHKSTDTSDSLDWQEAIWFLEEDYFVFTLFYPTVVETWLEYVSTIPDDASEEEFAQYLVEWRNHMEVYMAVLCKGNIDGKHETVEVWFNYGYGPFWKQEE